MGRWSKTGGFYGVLALVLTVSSCVPSKNRQFLCDGRLQKIVAADQAARKDIRLILAMKDDKSSMISFMHADSLRVKQVTKLISTGCIKTAEDHLNAALVLLHGGTVRYYYEAYICAKKALAMGSLEAKGILALAYDRYLLSVNKKQVFGSQAAIDPSSNCFCIPNLQPGFSDNWRKKHSGYTLHERINLYKKNTGMEMCANCKI